MPFECAPRQGLCFEFSIEPRIVLRLVHADAWLGGGAQGSRQGSRRKGRLKLEAVGSSPFLMSGGAFEGVAARGSVPSILLPRHGVRLGIFHSKFRSGYRHSLYTFATTWPYEILSYSRSFELPDLFFDAQQQWSYIQFVCGMVLLPNDPSSLLISYGQSDCEGRGLGCGLLFSLLLLRCMRLCLLLRCLPLLLLPQFACVMKPREVRN